MFVKRSISLGVGEQQVFSSTLIKRRQIDNTITAEQMLSMAQQQARQIIESAEADVAMTLEQARDQAQRNIAVMEQEFQQQFWQQANELLEQWHQQRQQMWDQIEQYAGRLLSETLTEILASVPEQLQVQSMLTQLAAVQRQAENAVLRCSDALYPAVQQYLQQKNISHWQIQVDPVIDNDVMILSTTSGEFQCRWGNIVSQLNGNEDVAAADGNADSDELLPEAGDSIE